MFRGKREDSVFPSKELLLAVYAEMLFTCENLISLKTLILSLLVLVPVYAISNDTTFLEKVVLSKFYNELHLFAVRSLKVFCVLQPF